MLTEQEKVMRCVCFDSFCKTILRNAIRNFYKQLSRLERREWLSDDPAFYQKAEAATADDPQYAKPRVSGNTEEVYIRR